LLIRSAVRDGVIGQGRSGGFVVATGDRKAGESDGRRADVGHR
jgi:hypothetical protein